MVSSYVLRKIPILNKIKELPEIQREKICPLWEALSSLEFQPEQYAVMGLVGALLAGTIPFICGSLMHVGIDEAFHRWFGSQDRAFFGGMVCALAGSVLSIFLFWLLHGRRYRRKKAAEVNVILEQDPFIWISLEELDPALARKFKKIRPQQPR